MIHYFLEVTLCWTVLIGVYYLFLKKETFFKSNRWYLIHSLWIGILLPLVRKLPFHFSNSVVYNDTVEYINVSTFALAQAIESPSIDSVWDWQTVLMTIYAIGLVVSLFRMFYGLIKILHLYQPAKKISKGEYTLVVTEDYHLPFSFFKLVFINQSFLEKTYIKNVLDHELIHVKHRHTYDVFFLQLISVLFWWNPIVYIYKKAIKETHEYLADAYACLDSDIKNYGQILLGQSSSGIELALTNQFFNSLLKKRITMLHQKKSAGYRRSKYLLVIPFLAFMVVLFSASTITEQTEKQVPIVLVNNDFESLLNQRLNEEGFNIIENVSKVYMEFRSKFPDKKDEIVERLTKHLEAYNYKLDISEDEENGFKVCVSNSETTGKMVKTLDAKHVPIITASDYKVGLVEEYNKLSADPINDLQNEFVKLYKKSQVYGEITSEVMSFDKLYKKYLRKYESEKQLMNDFKSIGCAYGVKVIFSKEKNMMTAFESFMFIVPKDSLDRFQAGLIPAYNEMVCGKNSFPSPPNIGEILDETDGNKVPLLIVEGQEIDTPYRGKVNLEHRHNLTVVPKEVAIKKYGERGKNGAYIIEYGEELRDEEEIEEIFEEEIEIGSEEKEIEVGHPNSFSDNIEEVIEEEEFETPSGIDKKTLYNGEEIELNEEQDYILDGHIELNSDEDINELNIIGKLYPDPNEDPERIITGKIMDAETKEPLIGANVIIEGTKKGTISDLTGQFELELISGAKFIEVSYVGYNNLKVDIRKSTVFEVYMHKGKATKISIRNEKDQTKLNIKDQFKNNPLFVIDGVILNEPLDDELDPDEIESINVIKGEIAIERYGKKGAKGVVIINTKNDSRKEINKKELQLEIKKEDREGENKIDPIIYVDGEKITEAEMKAIDPNTIATINVYKNESAVEKFGEGGNVGVIDITLKKKEKENESTSVSEVENSNNKDSKAEFSLSFKILKNPILNDRLEYEMITPALEKVVSEVYDIKGSVVKSATFTPQRNIQISTINLDGVIPGTYYLRLQQGNESQTRKFIINK